jgi:hypothetical protein
MGMLHNLRYLSFARPYSAPITIVQEALRQQVESELNSAEGRIEAISHRLDQRGSALLCLSFFELICVSWKTVERSTTKVHQPTLVSSFQIDRFKDDFRTILQQARGHVRTLISLSRTVTSPPTSPTSPTAPQITSLHGPETTRARFVAMTKLIGLLQRNLRVQYELDVVQVAHA